MFEISGLGQRVRRSGGALGEYRCITLETAAEKTSRPGVGGEWEGRTSSCGDGGCSLIWRPGAG